MVGPWVGGGDGRSVGEEEMVGPWVRGGDGRSVGERRRWSVRG